MPVAAFHAFEDELFAMESHRRYYSRVAGSKDYFVAVLKLLGG